MSRGGQILALLLAVAFGPAVYALSRIWVSNDSYTHGFLVPLFSLAAAWGTTRSLTAGQANPLGAMVLVAALLVYTPAFVSGSATLQGLALIGAIAGFVTWEWGTAGLRRLAFPIGYLVFMVPLPESILVPLILELQLWVSSTAVALLHAMGVTILREGNVMELPSGEQLFVAEACSGITSLVTLIPLAVALAWFAHESSRARWIVVLAAVPLALFFNLLRVVGTVLAVVGGAGGTFTEGPLHEYAGLVTFSLACGGLVALSSWLRPRRARVQPTPETP